MNSSIETLIDTHLAAYCEPDAGSRLATLTKIWNVQGRLVDPPLASTGPRGISDQAATLLQQFPGHRFRRTTGVDQHHEFARYGWKLENAEGVEVLQGIDFLGLDVDGRIMSIVGFFGPQPARTAG